MRCARAAFIRKEEESPSFALRDTAAATPLCTCCIDPKVVNVFNDAALYLKKVHNGVAAAVSLTAKEGLSSSFRINAARAQRNGRCGKIYAAVKKYAAEGNGNERKKKTKQKEQKTRDFLATYTQIWRIFLKAFSHNFYLFLFSFCITLLFLVKKKIRDKISCMNIGQKKFVWVGFEPAYLQKL